MNGLGATFTIFLRWDDTKAAVLNMPRQANLCRPITMIVRNMFSVVLQLIVMLYLSRGRHVKHPTTRGAGAVHLSDLSRMEVPRDAELRILNALMALVPLGTWPMHNLLPAPNDGIDVEVGFPLNPAFPVQFQVI